MRVARTEQLMSKLSDFCDALIMRTRILPELPVSAWWLLWCACFVLMLVAVVLQLLGLEWRVLNGLAGFGFVLLAFTPQLRISYRAEVEHSNGETIWLTVPRDCLADAIVDARVLKIERVETRDGRIRRVESLRLPDRET